MLTLPQIAFCWLAGWEYQREITLDTATPEDNFQVKVELTSANFNYSHAQTNGEDIRFTDNNDVLQDYWIEEWDALGTSTIWVEVATSATSTFYMYYGNISASDVCNGDDTFEFFDDFGDSTTPVIEWTPYENNPVLSPNVGKDLTTWGSVFKDGTTYHMFYSDQDYHDYHEISHATSTDGKNWTKDSLNNPVLTPGSSGTWDEMRVWCPMVWKEGTTWYMLYTGNNNAINKKIGLATASDPSGPWTRDAGNPVLEGTSGQWDENDAEGWGLIKVGSTYYLWYGKVNSERKYGLATSTNLTSWTKDINNPIFTGGRFCPDVFKYQDYYYMIIPHYTSGTDYSEFELYRDTNPTFYSADREFVKVVKTCPASGWDNHDEDTPWVLTNDISKTLYEGDELWVYYGGESGGVWQQGILIETDIDAALQGSTRDLDLDKWSITAGAVTVTNGSLRLTGTTGTRGSIESLTSFSYPKTLYSRAKYSQMNCKSTQFCAMQKSGDSSYSGGLTYNRWDSGLPATYAMDNGTYTLVDWTSIDTPINWHTYRMIWENGRSRSYQDDVLKADITTNVPTDDQIAWFKEGNQSGGDMDIDWVFVCKYTDPEPGTAVGEETTSSTVPPSNVTITISGNDVILNWEWSGERTTYNVYRSTDPYNGFVRINILHILGTTYTDSGAATGTKYFYYVTAE